VFIFCAQARFSKHEGTKAERHEEKFFYQFLIHIQLLFAKYFQKREIILFSAYLCGVIQKNKELWK